MENSDKLDPFYGDNQDPGADEIQITADSACPMVNGKLVGAGSTWYKSDITNGKLIVAYPAEYNAGPGEENLIFREYDIKDVVLSGWEPEKPKGKD